MSISHRSFASRIEKSRCDGAFDEGFGRAHSCLKRTMIPRNGARRASVLFGCALFVGIMGFCHVVRQDLSPLLRGMSRYAGSDTLAVATVAFLALAGATAALTSFLKHGLATRLVLFAAGGLVVVAATPIGNPATSVAVSALHTLGGLAFSLGRRRRDVSLSVKRWRPRPWLDCYLGFEHVHWWRDWCAWPPTGGRSVAA